MWLDQRGPIAIAGPNPPSPEVLAAYVAEVERRMGRRVHDLPALRVGWGVPERNVAAMTENAARLVHELKRREKTTAEVQADIEAFAAPFLRGFYNYATEGGDENIHKVKDVHDALMRLLDVVAEMVDWEPA